MTVLGAVVAIIVGLMTLGGSVFAATTANRSAARAEATLAAVEKAKESTEGRKLDLDVLRESIATLRTDLESERSALRSAEGKLARLTVSMAAHGQWDLLVLAEVRKVTPDFPEPPPLALLDPPAAS